MIKTIKMLVAVIIFLLTISCQQLPQSFLQEYKQIDLLITNGMIIDGLGSEAVLSDLVIVGDEIVFIGKTEFNLKDLVDRVKNHIDAKQNIVSPGFIDLHSHGDPLATPDFENFLAMGVTTISLGQDGDSPKFERLSDWLNEINKKGISVNLAMFVGHGTLRELSGIDQTIDPPAEAMKDMLTRLDETLAYTFGLTTGLEYNPGLYAQKEELASLAKVVEKISGLL